MKFTEGAFRNGVTTAKSEFSDIAVSWEVGGGDPEKNIGKMLQYFYSKS